MSVSLSAVSFSSTQMIWYSCEMGGGSSISISFIYGFGGGPGISEHHASKETVWLKTNTDALLYATEAIWVNSVHHGYVWPPLVDECAKESHEGMEDSRWHPDRLHPPGHVGEPDGMASAHSYLDSDESKSVTGSEVVIDGGYTVQ